jgi:hypothetical protein
LAITSPTSGGRSVGVVRSRTQTIERADDCNTDHYLLVAKFKENLAVKKKRSQIFRMERSNHNKLNEVEGKEQFRVEISNMFRALEDLDVELNINSAWKRLERI